MYGMKQIESYEDLKKRLLSEAEEKYRDFMISVTPSRKPILGVRIPKVRELAKSVPKDKIDDLLKEEPRIFEEVLFRGFLICRLPYKEMLKWFDSQVGYIGDWAACDTFCAALRPVIKNHKMDFLKTEINALLKDQREFATRIGLVILKNSYLECDFLPIIFNKVERLRNREEYYVRMGIAWLLSDCFVKFPEITYTYLVAARLPSRTINKTISKICDSSRVDAETKDMARKLRRQ